MSNIFKSEIIQSYKLWSGTGTGELTERNGEYAICMCPAPFWGGSGEYGNENFKGCLRGYFSPNTQYRFDLWIDADDSYYSSQSINVPGGFYIVFTDNTSVALTATGNKTNPVGYQHITYISPAEKTIDALNPYYYTNTPVYYRLDTYITSINNNCINKQGIVQTSTISEWSDITSINNGGTIATKSIIEF